MSAFHDLIQASGGSLAADGIALHFGDLEAEYEAALEHVVLMDRSHEGRLDLTGKDRLAILHRISTNDLMNMTNGEGRPTIFTNANGRILDRATIYSLGEHGLILGEPGRGAPLTAYLQRSIFFGDDVRLANLDAATFGFDLHGPRADEVAGSLASEASALQLPYIAYTAVVKGVTVTLAGRKALSGARWTIIGPVEYAAEVWAGILERGAACNLRPAGSLTFNTLRIRAALPGAGRELTQDYIPLEVGLWDEVSFSKGCYTGQEIIARMESRGRLANTIVSLKLEAFVQSPASLVYEGKTAGRLTSSVTSPHGEHFAIGVVKVAVAEPGRQLLVGETQVPATISALAGAQPPRLAAEAAS